MLTKIWTFIRHNQGLCVSTLIVIAVLSWAYGCQSEVTSIVNPTIFITRNQLQIEVDTFIAQAELKFADLDVQDSLKSTLFNTAIDFAKGGSINPVAIAIVLGNILGIGAVVDNRRKDVHIKTLKSNANGYT